MSYHPKFHDLKCWPPYFADILTGEKNFEVRKNDRDFQRGDILDLREFDPVKARYTGRAVSVTVTYILKATESISALASGYAVLAIKQRGKIRMNDYIMHLIEKDLDNARDNLARARSAAKNHSLTSQWGQSGKTLSEIIADYESWESKAIAAQKEILQ